MQHAHEPRREGRALDGKIALITGASSGIGRAAATLFAAAGAKLVLGARRAGPLGEVVDQLRAAGAEACALPGDVADEGYAAALVREATARFGGLDVAFNNAGALGPMGPTVEIATSAWEDALRTNLTSAFFAARAQLPALLARGKGSLVFTGTFVGLTAAFGGMAAYAASKAGLVGLVRALAVEHGRAGVRVNALLPGGTDTPMGRAVADSPEAQAHVAGLHALGRLAHPDEIARAALFLASDASSFITGAALFADGGVSIYRG